jgi:hypothetical protein
MPSTVAAGQPVDSDVDQLKVAASIPSRVDARPGESGDNLNELQAPTIDHGFLPDKQLCRGRELMAQKEIPASQEFLFKTTARSETPKGKSATPLTDRPIHPRRAVVHCLDQFSPWRYACSRPG